MFQKKSHMVKIKINYHAQALKNQKKKKIRKKKKKKRKKRGNVNAQEKKKGQHFCPRKREEKKIQHKVELFV